MGTVKDIWTTIVSCHNRAYLFEMNASDYICACHVVPNRVPRLWWWYQVCTPLWTRSGHSCPNISDRSEGETRSWQIVSSEIEELWSYCIQMQQIISEGINLHQFVLKPKFQRNPTISYDWTIVVFVTDRTTGGMLHKAQGELLWSAFVHCMSVNFFFKQHLLLNHWSKFHITSHECSQWCPLLKLHKWFCSNEQEGCRSSR